VNLVGLPRSALCCQAAPAHTTVAPRLINTANQRGDAADRREKL
jgi:hypothetical protein